MKKGETEQNQYKKETVDKIIISIFIFTAIVFLFIFYFQQKSEELRDYNNNVRIKKLIDQRDNLIEEIKKIQEGGT